jgi:PPOX class probable F420-dependent enzyme
MDAAQARHRFVESRVARLATADPAARPHVVPIVYGVVGETLYSAVDNKPKTTTALRRLLNVRANPAVAALVDCYDDADWRSLWWARADGVGRVIESADDEAVRALDVLAHKYVQYRDARPAGPLLAIDVHRWSGWSASDLRRMGVS